MLEIAIKFLEATAKAAGFADPQTIPEIIGAVINSFLSLLGVIFLVLIIYGGFIWMTSAGNEIKVYRAKEVLRSSIIGLIIIMSSYSITYFILHTLTEAAY